MIKKLHNEELNLCPSPYTVRMIGSSRMMPWPGKPVAVLSSWRTTPLVDCPWLLIQHTGWRLPSISGGRLLHP